MKIRNGFVSNSSTSSFVIMGFVFEKSKFSKLELLKRLFPDNADLQALTESDKDAIGDFWYELQDDSEYTFADDGDDGMPRGKMCVGMEIVHFSSEEGYIENCDVDVENMVSKLDKLKKDCGLPADAKARIVGGTRCC